MSSLDVYDIASGQKVQLHNTSSFAMPDADVIIIVSANLVKYNVVTKLPKGFRNIIQSSWSACLNDEIRLTYELMDYYKFDSLKVTDSLGNLIDVTDNKFKMPASDVVVTATAKFQYNINFTANYASGVSQYKIPGGSRACAGEANM